VKKARQSNYNFFSALTDKLFSLEKQEVVNFWHPRLLLASVLSSVVIHGDAFFLFFPARPLSVVTDGDALPPSGVFHRNRFPCSCPW
jgi:hypothetical protein